MNNAIVALFTACAVCITGCATDPSDPAGPGNGSGSDTGSQASPTDGQVYLSQQAQFAITVPQGFSAAEVHDPYCTLRLEITGDGVKMNGTFTVCYGQSGQGSTPDLRYDLALGAVVADCGASMNHEPCTAISTANPQAANDNDPNVYTERGNIHYEQRFYGISIQLDDPNQADLFPIMVAKLRLLN